MESFVRDTRYAVRSLARNAGFSVMTIAILMISMGSTTAIFSVVKGVLLDPLPMEEPDRLMSLWLAPVNGDGRSRMTPGNFTDIESLDGVFSHVAAFGGHTTSLSRDGESVFLRGGAVTPAYFETLGVRPVVGRTFRDDEGELGGPAVVVLGHHVWQQLFAAEPAIVGRTLTLDGADFQVVGVMPPGVYPTQATVSAEIPFTASNLGKPCLATPPGAPCISWSALSARRRRRVRESVGACGPSSAAHRASVRPRRLRLS